MSISSAQNLAAESIQSAQQKYKKNYDKNAHQVNFRMGDWVLIHFPQDKTGSGWKLSRPWHGPYQILKCDDPNLIVLKVYFPEHEAIQIHQTRVKPCPMGFPADYYWYGQRRHGPGRPPQWLENSKTTKSPSEPKEKPNNSERQLTRQSSVRIK